MIIAGNKLSPLWQTGWLPVLFLISAILMGYAMVIFESLYSSAVLKIPYEMPALSKIGKLVAWVAVVYIILRFSEIILNGKLVLLFTDGWLNRIMFVIENLLFIVPAILLFSKKHRRSTKSLFFIAIALVFAGAIYRFNAYLVGFNPGIGWHYWPSASEILITIGIIAMEIIAYLVFIKKLSVLPNIKHSTTF